jgi:hypothetical protein
MIKKNINIIVLFSMMINKIILTKVVKIKIKIILIKVVKITKNNNIFFIY